jgi:hypothetical protein
MKKLLLVMGLLFPFILFAQSSFEEGLVAHFPFNGDAYDQTGNGNSGVVHGATLTTDRYGNEDAAYFFNGQDNYISIEDNPQLRMSSVTMALWVTFLDLPTNQRNLISKPVGTWNYDSYVLWYQYDGMSFHIGNIEGSGQVTHYNWIPELEQWYFMACTYDEVTQMQTIYINGQEVASGFTVPIIGWDEHPVLIGVESDIEQLVYWHYGKLDDILIYNKALTPQEIMNLYETFGLAEDPDDHTMHVNVFPNPCSDIVHLKLNVARQAELKGELLSSNGEVVREFVRDVAIPGDLEMKLDVKDLPAGLYILRISDGDHTSSCKLSVVNK